MLGVALPVAVDLDPVSVAPEAIAISHLVEKVPSEAAAKGCSHSSPPSRIVSSAASAARTVRDTCCSVWANVA